MLGYLKRLVTTGAAYQFGDIVAKGIALLTLPLYTRHVAPSGYGAAESLLTAVILASILLRLGRRRGVHPLLLRRRGRRRAATRIARTGDGDRRVDDDARRRCVAVAFAGPLSQLLLGFHDPLLIDCAMLGLWAFTNLEMAYAQLRVDERARAYMFASGANVAMTRRVHGRAGRVRRTRARAACCSATSAPRRSSCSGLWWVLRAALLAARALRRPARDAALRPADGAGRRERLRAAGRRPLLPVPRLLARAPPATYAVALKLATVVFVAVRGFQYAWPPLAYSIESDDEAARLYSLVTTYYVLATGVVVCAVALLGRWIVRLLAAPAVLRRLHARCRGSRSAGPCTGSTWCSS